MQQQYSKSLGQRTQPSDKNAMKFFGKNAPQLIDDDATKHSDKYAAISGDVIFWHFLNVATLPLETNSRPLYTICPLKLSLNLKHSGIFAASMCLQSQKQRP